jgi:DNA-binding NtrC family response regulator
MEKRVLVVDDDPGMRETLEAVLTADGYTVSTAENGKEALDILGTGSFDIMLLDLKMPDCLGTELLPKVKSIAPEIVVIMMTAFGTIKSAVEALKLGAYDFITKPFELEEMRMVIQKAFELQQLSIENEEVREKLNDNFVLKGIVGKSPAMKDVFKIIKKVVNYDVTILITGESGTGKGLIAHAIHHNSSRREMPFVKLNCAALPETLLESELFGYERGAFTGATSSKPGRFEYAKGGTLFLDEICDTSPAMQAKLLRVLQEKEFERVGGTKTIKSDVRVVAATNKDIKKEVDNGNFRPDLYFRLNVVPIHLPPLRERIEDTPELVHFILKELNDLFNKNFGSISHEAMNSLLKYQWPGNIRELRNMLEKAVLLGDGTEITVEYLPDELNETGDYPEKTASKGVTTLEDMEKVQIYDALRKNNWNQTKTAECLGIHRNTLREKIKKFDIQIPTDE